MNPHSFPVQNARLPGDYGPSAIRAQGGFYGQPRGFFAGSEFMDRELELDGLLDGQVAGAGTVQDLVDVAGGSIARHPSTGGHAVELTSKVYEAVEVHGGDDSALAVGAAAARRERSRAVRGDVVYYNIC
jgi:hypothetical protein